MLFVFLIYYKLARANPAKFHFSAYTYYCTVFQNLKYIRRFEFLLQNAIFRLVPRMTINIDIAMEIPKSMIHFSFLSHEPPSLKYSTKYPMMYSDLHDID